MKKVTIIESSSSTKQGDPLGGFFICFGSLSNSPKDHHACPQLCISILNGWYSHRGAYSEITHAFDHFSTQLALVGLRVKVLKCKLWSPLGIFPSIKVFQGCILVTNGFAFWLNQWVFKILPCIFWMKFYFRTWCILMIFLS